MALIYLLTHDFKLIKDNYPDIKIETKSLLDSSKRKLDEFNINDKEKFDRISSFYEPSFSIKKLLKDNGVLKPSNAYAKQYELL